MTTTIDINLETADTSQFTSVTGTPTATNGAALHGSYGLNVPLGTTAHEGRKDIAKQSVIRLRFYFDPNTVTIGASDAFSMHRIIQSGGSFLSILAIHFRLVSGNYNVRILHANDAGTNVLDDNVNVTDAPHYIEVHIVRATNSTSNDGYIEWWMDNVSQGSVSSIDNFNRMDDVANWRTLFGNPDGDAGSSGNFFIDDIVANDTGTLIGAYGGSWSNISKYSGISQASISKVSGTAKASIGKINGVSV